LPDYKGLLLVYRALQNEERFHGITLHDVAPKIDKGNIIDIRKTPLYRSHSVFDAYMDLVPLSIEAVSNYVESTNKGLKINSIPQHKKGNYYSNPTTAEMEEFESQGIYFVNAQDYITQTIARFSKPDTEHAKGLENALNKALSGFTPATPSKDRQSRTAPFSFQAA